VDIRVAERVQRVLLRPGPQQNKYLCVFAASNIKNELIMARVKIYSTGVCPLCQKAKALLQKWNVPFEEIRIDTDRSRLTEFARATNGARTVPQILIDGKCIGGFTELTELHMEGGLDELVETPKP
jgi:glutaredoxin 3